MENLKIGVVEDEFIIAATIRNTLIKLGYTVPPPVGTYTMALEMIEREKPDLLLLDIQLSGSKDGIDLAWKVKEDYNIPFIFLTANADPATIEKAKKVCPPAYLVKPFVKEDLYAAIEICIYNSRRDSQPAVEKENPNYVLQDALFVKENNCFHKILFKDILYLESERVYINIHTASKKTYLIRASMQDYLRLFDPNIFYRIHRSYVVNLEQVDGIKDRQVMIKGHEVPISRTFRDELLSKLKLG